MIYINNIPSLRKADNGEDFLIDDRKEVIKLINGTTIQNGGIFFGGFNLSVVFSNTNFELIKTLWLADQTVTFTTSDGVVFSGLTLKFIKWRPLDDYPEYTKLDFELLKASTQANSLS